MVDHGSPHIPPFVAHSNVCHFTLTPNLCSTVPLYKPVIKIITDSSLSLLYSIRPVSIKFSKPPFLITCARNYRWHFKQNFNICFNFPWNFFSLPRLFCRNTTVLPKVLFSSGWKLSSVEEENYVYMSDVAENVSWHYWIVSITKILKNEYFCAIHFILWSYAWIIYSVYGEDLLSIIKSVSLHLSLMTVTKILQNKLFLSHLFHYLFIVQYLIKNTI